MKTSMKICVVQLTRIGDIIQTYQAAKQLKTENPNIELTLIARKKFSQGLEFLLKDVFTNVIELNTQDFFKSNKDDLHKVHTRLHNFIHDIKKFDFDLVVNLSFNKSSSFLTSLISKNLKMGIYRNSQAQVGMDDKWSQFVYSNVMGGTNTPINLVDIYKNMLGAKEIDVTNFETPQNKVITIHPFASSAKKSWGMGKWNELIYKILKDDPEVSINMVGAPTDVEQAERIMSNPAIQHFEGRVLNKVGVNSIEDTFNDLSNSHMFIGHDSMVSHLAGIFRMPSLILSLGSVRPHETNPYNDRTYNLTPRNKCFPCKIEEKCDLLPCHGSINHQTVVAITKKMLAGEDITRKSLMENLTGFHLDTVNILKSSFDEAGIKLDEITENNMSTKEVFRTFYRILWSYYLTGKDVGADLPKVSPDVSKALATHLDGSNYLHELYNYGFTFCNRILDEAETEDPSIQKIQEGVNKLNEIDNLCNITKQTYSHLGPIIDFFYVNKANALGSNIIEITNNNLISFHEATNLAAILNDLITKTVGPRVEQTVLPRQDV
jgi:ADP-heptose:LPS heptosyltransferase